MLTVFSNFSSFLHKTQ